MCVGPLPVAISTVPAPKLFQAAPLGKSKGKEGEKQPP